MFHTHSKSYRCLVKNLYRVRDVVQLSWLSFMLDCILIYEYGTGQRKVTCKWSTDQGYGTLGKDVPDVSVVILKD